MEKTFNKLNLFLLCFFIFLFPLFFLPITQEFYLTNKLYLISFGALFLLLISTIKFAFTKKITWQKGLFDNLLVLFLLTLAISIVLSSPNKIQAILNPNFGLLTFFSLTILYFYLSRISINFYLFLSISTLFLSIITIIFFFQPFKNINLPQPFQFLKNPTFTPLGSQLDLAIFLGFFTLVGILQIIKQEQNNEKLKNKHLILNAFFLIITLTALSLTLYTLLKPSSTNLNQLQLVSTPLPPFRLSWYAAVEILKNPKTAFFGVGVDNFASIFTRVKDIVYNQSPLWQIFSFNFSRSAILHLITETGILGFVAFVLLFISIVKKLISTDSNNFKLISPILFGYLFICLLLFPPSLITWFLLFVVLAELSSKDVVTHVVTKEINLTELLPFYIVTIIFSLIFIGGGSYLLGRAYASEVYFKTALDGIVKNDAKQAYDNMRNAIILNPFIERYRINFSQLNLILANNIAQKAGQPQGKDQKPYELTEQDRQNISQAIQAAISEAKAAVSLNSQKALNWENLAEIYRNIINTAQGADVWTISSYQRAIVSDPQNPVYRLNLGGVYYSLGNFEEATKIFEQAVVLKPDWPNAYYNLAWANYQKQNYQAAVSAMENVVRLLDPKKDKIDFEKAQKELEEFKKQLPKEEKETTQEAVTQPRLTLPSPIPTGQPKIELPKEASPEAQ